jgi:hypothetical protein
MVRRSSVFARQDVAELMEHWTADVVHSTIQDILTCWDCLDLEDTIQWGWNPRLRTTLGRAIPGKMRVELNPLLLARHPGHVRHVLIHELAHLVAIRLHGRQAPHGGAWKQLMQKAGESPRATHNLDVRDLRRKPARRRRTGRRLPKIFWGW